jgi:hypothetical protein
MLYGVGNSAGIELPYSLKDGTCEWLYSRGAYRIMLRMRGSHSGGWLTQSALPKGGTCNQSYVAP